MAVSAVAAVVGGALCACSTVGVVATFVVTAVVAAAVRVAVIEGGAHRVAPVVPAALATAVVWSARCNGATASAASIAVARKGRSARMAQTLKDEMVDDLLTGRRRPF